MDWFYRIIAFGIFLLSLILAFGVKPVARPPQTIVAAQAPIVSTRGLQKATESRISSPAADAPHPKP